MKVAPLRRTWIEQPYGEEEITLLEEEVIPALSGLHLQMALSAVQGNRLTLQKSDALSVEV